MTSGQNKPKKRYSIDEINKRVKEWKESGKSQLAFSRDKEINYYALNKWINAERRKDKKSKATVKGFATLAVTEDTSRLLFAEIKKEGVTILLHHPVTSDFLRALIK